MNPTTKSPRAFQIYGIALSLAGLLLIGLDIGKKLRHAGENSALMPMGLLLVFLGVALVTQGASRIKKAKDEAAK